MSVQSWFNRIWYDVASPPWWLVPFSVLYAAVARSRRVLYAKHVYRVSRPPCAVVVVGNLSVGGAGKTPLVCWLVAQLIESGYKPGIVTRGYGGSSSSVRRICAADDPNLVGDEPILLARRTGAPIVAGRNRPAAADLLLREGCDVIVSDDGLQHYALARDCEVVVIDGDRRFGNGWLLPAGPLRELPGRLKAVDAIVVNGGPAVLPGASPGSSLDSDALLSGAFRMRLEAADAVALGGGNVQRLSAWAGRSIHAVAGIGHPQRFFNMLRSQGIEVTGHAFADHARLTRGDIEFGDDKPVFMTEKDAVKCSGFVGEQHYYVPVTACFDGADSITLLRHVRSRISGRDRGSQGSIDG